MKLYWVSKYTASGSWNGEAVKRNLTRSEVFEWLRNKKKWAEDYGYDVALFRKPCLHLEISHDSVADVFNYHIERE